MVHPSSSNRGELRGRHVAHHFAQVLTQGADVRGELHRACGCFAAPEGDVGRLTVSVLHEDASGASLDTLDEPRGVAEKEDVARHAFDGVVFVDGADVYFLRHGDHAEERRLGDRAATGDGGDACSAPRAQFSIYSIAVDVGAVASALGGDAFGEHVEDGVE
jgi:hypothetical protein